MPNRVPSAEASFRRIPHKDLCLPRKFRPAKVRSEPSLPQSLLCHTTQKRHKSFLRHKRFRWDRPAPPGIVSSLSQRLTDSDALRKTLYSPSPRIPCRNSNKNLRNRCRPHTRHSPADSQTTVQYTSPAGNRSAHSPGLVPSTRY